MSEEDTLFRAHTLRQRKPDGSFKTRELLIPGEEVRRQHELMLPRLYGLEIDMPHATGGLPGNRLVDNVIPHRQNNHFYVVDIQDAFQNVDPFKLLKTASARIENEQERLDVIDFILRWATTPQTRGLPLGAPCSPYLFNLYCLPMDEALGEYCAQREITYTRYFDDLTFSSVSPLSKERLKSLRGLVSTSDRNLQLNLQKSRHHSLSEGPFYLTGLSLQPDRSIQPAPRLIEAANSVFEEFGDIAPEAMLYDDEIGRIHGWHGVIKMLSLVETPTLRSLDRKYHKALGRTAYNS